MKELLLKNKSKKTKAPIDSKQWEQTVTDLANEILGQDEVTVVDLMLNFVTTLDFESLFKLAYEMHSDLTVETLSYTLGRKRRDYGKQAIEANGLPGVVVRLNDKVHRLINLLGTDSEPNNESIDDTYFDICGYCIIAIALQKGNF